MVILSVLSIYWTVLNVRNRVQVNKTSPHVIYGRYKTQATGHRSQVIGHFVCKYRKNPKHSLKLTLGLIRPKQEFLGLILVLVNGWDCLHVYVLVKQ